jgi:hypothetical protein
MARFVGKNTHAGFGKGSIPGIGSENIKSCIFLITERKKAPKDSHETLNNTEKHHLIKPLQPCI